PVDAARIRSNAVVAGDENRLPAVDAGRNNVAEADARELSGADLGPRRPTVRGFVESDRRPAIAFIQHTGRKVVAQTAGREASGGCKYQVRNRRTESHGRNGQRRQIVRARRPGWIAA